jgi:hypothetical protein
MASPARFTRTRPCDMKLFQTRLLLMRTSTDMGMLPFRCSANTLENHQRPNKSLEPTAGRCNAHFEFYETVSGVCHARSRQRWLSSVSLGREQAPRPDYRRCNRSRCFHSSICRFRLLQPCPQHPGVSTSTASRCRREDRPFRGQTRRWCCLSEFQVYRGIICFRSRCGSTTRAAARGGRMGEACVIG